MALIVDSFGKNIYVHEELVGYIGRNILYIGGKKFADISDEGVISYDDIEIGYVDEDGSIIVKDEEVGYVDPDNNFVFYKVFKK